MTFELNKFADRTEDEFRNTILMRPQAPPIHSRSRYMKVHDIGDLPDSFDWRDHNAVTPVKDQGKTKRKKKKNNLIIISIYRIGGYMLGFFNSSKY